MSDIETEVREAYTRPIGMFGHYGQEARVREFEAWLRSVRAVAWDEGQACKRDYRGDVIEKNPYIEELA